MARKGSDSPQPQPPFSLSLGHKEQVCAHPPLPSLTCLLLAWLPTQQGGKQQKKAGRGQRGPRRLGRGWAGRALSGGLVSSSSRGSSADQGTLPLGAASQSAPQPERPSRRRAALRAAVARTLVSLQASNHLCCKQAACIALHGSQSSQPAVSGQSKQELEFVTWTQDTCHQSCHHATLTRN